MTSSPSKGGDAQARQAKEHVHKIVINSGTSFYWGMRILSPARRDGMYAVYAFCREVDDIADDEGVDEPQRLSGLADWREEIERIYDGCPQTLTGKALLTPVRDYDLQRQDFIAIIDGMEMDARDPIRAPTMEELELYCARVAGAVGLLSTRVFGDASPQAQKHALVLGEALQLTNILRDLVEDAGRGRLYLPQELLKKYNISDDSPEKVLAHPDLPKVCAALAEKSLKNFKTAQEDLLTCNRWALRPASIMREMYHGILERLIKRGWAHIDGPVKVPMAIKLWIIFKNACLTSSSSRAG